MIPIKVKEFERVIDREQYHHSYPLFLFLHFWTMESEIRMRKAKQLCLIISQCLSISDSKQLKEIGLDFDQDGGEEDVLNTKSFLFFLRFFFV